MQLVRLPWQTAVQVARGCVTLIHSLLFPLAGTQTPVEVSCLIHFGRGALEGREAFDDKSVGSFTQETRGVGFL